MNEPIITLDRLSTIPSRVIVEGITPQVDAGRYAIKRVLGERVGVEADCFTDGHERLACALRYRPAGERRWQEAEMAPLGNDRWRGEFVVDRLGTWQYCVAAWLDRYASWRHDFERRVDAQDIWLAAQDGAALVEEAAARTRGAERTLLQEWSSRLKSDVAIEELRAIGLDEELAVLMRRHLAPLSPPQVSAELPVTVERVRARFSSWYELFPRSTAGSGLHYGRFADVAGWLDYVVSLGFDILYFPPIHPIGRQQRKGRNNRLEPTPDDVGSPWAIGSAEGGHKAVHPALGTLAEFRELLHLAAERGLEIALDIAFQCAPDHPYVAEHPEWFRHRADGSVQYAENPPKKYQDIYPFDFENQNWRALWQELCDVMRFWIGQGVRIFRVDNPHTKPFAFWEWAIAEIRREHPDVIFLSEAFTRPKVMHELAKLGFSQSYTYFTWRQSKRELIDYFTELAQQSGREYFRPNCWPNTPDILPGHLQTGSRAIFMARLVLAATLAANYGIYGPAFELMEHQPREAGSEEYRDSEKYQLRAWDIRRPDSLAEFIARVNRIRREHEALQWDWSLRFHVIDNDMLMCYSKTAPGGEDVVIVVVNLDHRYVQSGWTTLDLAALGLPSDRAFGIEDLLTGARYTWQGAHNFVRLDPALPAHIFVVLP